MINSPLQFQINYCMPCCLKDVCFNKPVLTLWSTPSRTSRSRPCRFSWSCPVSFWLTSSWWPSGVCVAAGSHGKHSEVDHQSPPTVKYTMSNLHPTYRYIVSIVKFCKALLQAWGNFKKFLLTTPLTKLRYLGIMSSKSSVMKTLLTYIWKK